MITIFKRPMAFAAVLAFFAIVISYYLHTTVLFVVLAILISIVAVFLKRDLRLVMVSIAILSVLFSLQSTNKAIKRLNNLGEGSIRTTFVAVEDSKGFDGYNSVTVISKESHLIPNGTKFLMFYYTDDFLTSGDMFVADVKLSSLENSEYKLFDYSNSIYAGCSAVSIERLDIEDKLYNFVGRVRNYVRNTLSSVFGGDICGLLTALTTGDKSGLSEDFSNNVMGAGISHIIVVSGLHLSIIMNGIFNLPDNFFYNRYIRCAVSIILVFLITAVCGFSMSIIRAGIMYLIAGFAPIFKRDNDSLNSLGTAVIIVLISAPFAVFNVSFQLSVLATLAIVWMVPFYQNLISQFFNIKSKILFAVLNILLGSIFATAFTMPVLATRFGYVSMIAPITNLLVTYPVSWALEFNIIGLLSNLSPIFSSISNAAFLLAGFCAKYIIWVVNLLCNAFGGTVRSSNILLIFSIFVIFVLILVTDVYNYKRTKSLGRESF